MMVRAKRQNLNPVRLMRPIAWMLVVFYMGYHALHGERGLYALMREQRELSTLTADYEKTKAERTRMEIRVRNLRHTSLDRDLLDEQMRRMLGVMRQGEVVVLDGGISR
jgi:cell division protein FtsB